MPSTNVVPAEAIEVQPAPSANADETCEHRRAGAPAIPAVQCATGRSSTDSRQMPALLIRRIHGRHEASSPRTDDEVSIRDTAWLAIR